MSSGRVFLTGDLDAFHPAFKDLVAECGFAVFTGGRDVSPSADDLPVIGVSGTQGLKAADFETPRPFLVYTGLALPEPEMRRLKEAGLLGVICAETPPEDLAFLFKKAFFYEKMLRRNPRAPVNIPIALSFGTREVSSFATLLSRDGIFVVSLNPPPVNSVCTLRFNLPGIRKELATGARVLYQISVNRDLNIISSPGDPFKRLVSHPGMALLFTDMPEKDRELIESYIETVF
ncbi:MAG: PilZ domain-containing protein [Deltaproteobacteria bacterium]|nr:PilZ domain-containing protein [Deltaproteobacteria bacterium]MBZ0220065.1 PilZ domain-containing protein [Deltaproteobacteria bacterium]